MTALLADNPQPLPILGGPGMGKTTIALKALHEPQWPAGLDRVWGGWGPLRGRLVPGTAIFVAQR